MADMNTFYIRFFNAVSDIGEVEFYVNDKLISSLVYRGFSEYYPANIGSYKVSVYLKATKELLAQEVLNFEHEVYTFAITGLEEEMSLNIIKSENIKPNKNSAKMRFCNLAPYDTNFGIKMNNNLIIADLGYEEITEFFETSGGTYSVEFLDNNGKTVLIDPKMTLRNGKIYTGYIVGVEGQGSGLQILIPLEGLSYIDM